MRINLTRKMIGLVMIIVLVSAAGFGAVVYSTQQVLERNRNIAEDDLVRLSKGSEIALNAQGQVSNIRGYLAYGTDNYLTDYQAQAKANDKLEAELAPMVKTDAGRKLVAEMRTLGEQFRTITEQKLIPLKKAGKEQEAELVARQEIAPVGRALIAKAREYQTLTDQYTQAELRRNVEAGEGAQQTALGIAAAVVLLGIGIGFYAARIVVGPLRKVIDFVAEVAEGDLREHKQTIRSQDELGELATAVVTMRGHLRELVQHLEGTTDQVTATAQQMSASAEVSAGAAEQIASTMQQVAHGAERQLEAVEGTSAVVEQMSAGVQQIAVSAEKMAGTAEKTAESATEGSRAIESAMTQMESIERTVTESAQVVLKLGERSKEIGQIVDAISSIAGQTNLLALNAAIEAARAGEQGRGFAVVAEEVRKLAEQSQGASQQIAELIQAIQQDTDRAVVAMSAGTSEVSKGSMVVGEAGESFQKIFSLVRQVTEEVHEISAAMQQMNSGSQEIVSAVRAIDDVCKEAVGRAQTVSAATEEQTATVQEIAASSASLSNMAEEMGRAVHKFRLA